MAFNVVAANEGACSPAGTSDESPQFYIIDDTES
jgi:hypothetical protein